MKNLTFIGADYLNDNKCIFVDLEKVEHVEVTCRKTCLNVAVDTATSRLVYVLLRENIDDLAELLGTRAVRRFENEIAKLNS